MSPNFALRFPPGDMLLLFFFTVLVFWKKLPLLSRRFGSLVRYCSVRLVELKWIVLPAIIFIAGIGVLSAFGWGVLILLIVAYLLCAKSPQRGTS